MGVQFEIRPVLEADLQLIGAWRAMPHVSRWWGDTSLEPEREKLSDPRISMWIIEAAGRPFAFIQDYDVHGWSPHHFDDLPAGSRGMDLYIGPPDMIGHGHGARMLRQHVDGLFSLGVPAVGIDPHPSNAAARRAFEKAGFVVSGGPLQTRWSYALLMHRYATRPPASERPHHQA